MFNTLKDKPPIVYVPVGDTTRAYLAYPISLKVYQEFLNKLWTPMTKEHATYVKSITNDEKFLLEPVVKLQRLGIQSETHSNLSKTILTNIEVTSKSPLQVVCNENVQETKSTRNENDKKSLTDDKENLWSPMTKQHATYVKSVTKNDKKFLLQPVVKLQQLDIHDDIGKSEIEVIPKSPRQVVCNENVQNTKKVSLFPRKKRTLRSLSVYDSMDC